MGLEKIGINAAKSGVAFLKSGYNKYLLQVKQPIFHGINPTLTYPLSGKTFNLPRFGTVEMAQARQMNKIVTREIKTASIPTFSKASPEDLRRLTSSAVDATSSRVRWTNPKDGKVYNLLKQGESQKGDVIVRILDEDGAFVKEATIKPKTIGIIDSRGQVINHQTNIPEIDGLTHIKTLELFAKRNNPFAKYKIIDASYSSDVFSGLDENKILKAIKDFQKDGGIDYLNCSFGHTVFASEIELASNRGKQVASELDKLATKGVRVLKASGNGDANYFGQKTLEAEFLNSSRIEGVGSLSNKGKISSFSGSRSSKYTQHYEKGEYPVTQTPEGVNITGLTGTDIVLEKNPFVGKTLGRIRRFIWSVPEESELIQKHGYEKGKNLYKELSEKYKKYNVYSSQLHFPNAKYEGDNAIAELYIPKNINISGTSFSTPTRVAKLALNDMMEGIL